MQANVPDSDTVQGVSADQALMIKRRLQAAPRLLGKKEASLVSRMIKACEQRLAALEVDGLVARYERLPDGSKRAFLDRIGVLERG